MPSKCAPTVPAHVNGKPLVPLPCAHIVQDITKEIEEQIESYKVVIRDYPDSMVGTSIFIYWKDDDVWYKAKIIKYLDNSRKFRLLYDDRTEEKLDLSIQWFCIEDDRTKALYYQRKRELKAAGLSMSTSEPPPSLVP